jgi:HIRAN domain
VAGFFRRLFGSGSVDQPQGRTRSTQAWPNSAQTLRVLDLPDLKLAGDELDRFGFEVVGESHRQDALRKVVAGQPRNRDGGYRVQSTADLVPEPENAFDPNAVAVYISGLHVGYVPREAAAYVQEPLAAIVSSGNLPTCDAVVVGGAEGRPSLGVWLDLDDDIVPLTPEIATQLAQRRQSAGRPWTGESDSPRSAAGQHRGKHYTEWVDDVKALKRHEAYGEAHDLLQHLVEAVEQEAKAEQWAPAPWYYEQLAIVNRKLADYDGEVATLERYIEFATSLDPAGPRPEMLERLPKARALRLRKTGR